MVKHRHITEKEENPQAQRVDYLLILVILMLSIFGIIMVFDSSVELVTNQYHFVFLQSLWVGIGMIGMVVLSRYYYKIYAKFALPLMIGSILLLILVLLIGQKANGAIRWINLGAFEFQPSELTKPIIILYLAAWFTKEKPLIKDLKERVTFSFFNELIPFLGLLLLVVILVILERDLGTAIIISVISLSMFFIQGKGFTSLLSSMSATALMIGGAVLAIVLEPYRAARLLVYAGQSSGSLSTGYQINQILIAIGSGGWFGKGFTQSIQKDRYLVETTAITDSIFAVIAEEFGFIGSLILLFGYLFFAIRCIRIAVKTQDMFGKLVATGIVIWIISQTLLNIAVNVNLVPLTGVPLPFISYGGSSTIIMLCSLGIVLNISRYAHDEPQK